MKKIFAVILTLILMYQAAFANDDSLNEHISNALALIFKTTGDKNLLNASAYYITTVSYNRITITAFKSNTSNWKGFFKQLTVNDLPDNTLKVILKKYHTCKIEKVIMYIQTDGEIKYFAAVTHGKTYSILKIDTTGDCSLLN